MADSPEMLTIGDLSKVTGARKHQLNYAIEEYGIEPVQRAGIIRLFHRDQLPLIKSALRRIAGRKELAHA
jgi:hypothetical protein